MFLEQHSFVNLKTEANIIISYKNIGFWAISLRDLTYSQTGEGMQELTGGIVLPWIKSNA